MGLNVKFYLKIPNDAIVDDAGKEIHKGLNAVGNHLRSVIIKSMKNSPANGVIYRKIDPKRTHTASTRGNAPRVDTGALWRSINFEVGGQSVSIGASTAVDYAKVLEESKGKRARPFIAPAINQSERQMAGIFERAIEKLLKDE